MSSTDFRLGEFVVQPATDRLVRGDQRVELEPKTMAVLVALAARPGEVVSSDELIRDIWHDRAMGDNPVYKSVAKLRRALDDEADEPRYIETIPRKGYRLIAKPEPVIAPRPEARPPRRSAWPGIAAAAALALVIGGYAATRTGVIKVADSSTSAVVPKVYFSGLESDSPEAVAIDRLIRNRLSQLPGLTISERAIDAPLASFRLSGTARSGSGGLRVQLRLDGERGAGLWSSDLTLSPDEAYRVAEQVAAAVQEAASISRGKKRTESLPFTTLQAYLQARTELRERRPGFRERLMNASAEVVRSQPSFAPGHAMRADACLFVFAFESASESKHVLQCARDAVARALALDPELAEAHAAAGFLSLTEARFCVDGCSGSQRVLDAQRSLERAVRLDPSLLEARVWLANAYDEQGDLTRAAEQREAAVALDPLSPIANFHMNNVLLARGERERVRERLQRVAQSPGMPQYLYQQLAEVAIAEGRLQEACGWARHVTAADDIASYQLIAATLLARCGATDEARDLFARVPWKPRDEDDEDLYHAVQLHQILGGAEAVRRLVNDQLEGFIAGQTPDARMDQRLRQAIGWAFVMADEPARARPWLENSEGARDAPNLGVQEIQSAADVLEAFAWVKEQEGDASGARELAQAAIERLSIVASAGMDKNTAYALSHALALGLSGQREPALAELERAVTLGWREPAFVRADPRWAGLLRDPAAQALLARADRRAPAARVAAVVRP